MPALSAVFTRKQHFVRWSIGGSLVAVVMLVVMLVWPLSSHLLQGGQRISPRITDRNGVLLRELTGDGRGRPIALHDVEPAVVQALIVTEDRNFFRHHGIDPNALIRAAWSNFRNRSIVSGGSTLTMQVARALRDREHRNVVDKVLEMILAIRLEIYLSKDEILSLWLNRVNFGNAAYGIEAASRLYFGKSARDLTLAESTYLIGLPQSPGRYNPFRYPERARNRQRYVLAAMQRHGLLTAGKRKTVESTPLDLLSAYSLFRAPHFIQAFMSSIRDRKTPVVEVRTTLDWSLQQAVEALMRGHIYRLAGHDASNAAVVVLENETGNVLAYAGSIDFWNDRIRGQNDGVRMLRQPGSTLKPFTYAHALSTGRYTPASILADLPLQIPEAGGAFSPENYDKQYHGPVPVRQALACSYNIPAVRLGREIGATALLHTLHRAGFRSLQQPPEFYGAGLTLGNGEVTLLELARAYAGLARGGALPPVRTEIWRRTVRDDTLYAVPAGVVSTGLNPEVTYLISHILSDAEAREPAFGRGGPLELPFPCAVKTGTSKDYRDNWAVGFTPRHTVAVWVGNFDGKPMQWVSGVSGAGPLLKAVFFILGSGGAFEVPRGIVQARICPAGGKKPGTFCTGSRMEWFVSGTVPKDTCTVHRRIAIDTRSGLLADSSTPRTAVKMETFTVYGPEFLEWMRDHGLKMPPQVTEAQVIAASKNLKYSDRLRIQYPLTGTRFQIDPILRRDYQRVRLRATVDESLFHVAWYVDGVKMTGDFRNSSWPLETGKHAIELRGVDEKGITLRSRPSIIHVSGL